MAPAVDGGLGEMAAEQMQRNLIQVQDWAERHNLEHLGQGMLDLYQRVSQLNAGLRSLMTIVPCWRKSRGSE